MTVTTKIAGCVAALLVAIVAWKVVAEGADEKRRAARIVELEASIANLDKGLKAWQLKCFNEESRERAHKNALALRSKLRSTVEPGEIAILQVGLTKAEREWEEAHDRLMEQSETIRKTLGVTDGSDATWSQIEPLHRRKFAEEEELNKLKSGPKKGSSNPE